MDPARDLGEQIAHLLDGPPGVVWDLRGSADLTPDAVPIQEPDGSVIGYACRDTGLGSAGGRLDAAARTQTTPSGS